MKILILNCDFDPSPETNGAVLIRKQLLNYGYDENNITTTNLFDNQFPEKNTLSSFSRIIITGSRASAYGNTPWVKKFLDLIHMIDDLSIPTLGICFGFHAVTQALSGNIRLSDVGEEGFVEVKLSQDGINHPLFNDFPQQFLVYQSHCDIIEKFPLNAVLLAQNNHSIQSYAIRNFVCIQFHPEITPSVAKTMAVRDGRNIKQILNSVDENYNLPTKIIENFLKS
ncbi:MAG: type 1 glutamine amidotransferase [Candidatus Aenigmatarchaeota archaeon]